MRQQKILITESPQHTDTWQTAILGGLYIYITVTHINSMTAISL